MIRTLAFLATMAAFAAASCPNSCSGHGRCNAFDQCECQEQRGTARGVRKMQTGPDCSQRTCPIGISFAALSDTTDDVQYVALLPQKKFDGSPQATSAAKLNVRTEAYKLTRDATFQVRVLEVASSGVVRVQWKLKEHDKQSAIQDIYQGATAPQSFKELKDSAGLLPAFETAVTGETGVEIQFTDNTNVQPNNLYEFHVQQRNGRSHVKGDSNTAHQQAECSGQGSCDRTTGQCQCFAGYSGESCQRTTCPNDCSGHGLCQSLKRIVADTNVVTYSKAFDASKVHGCVCDPGYQGVDCSKIECPSGPDPLGGPGGNGFDGNDKVAPALECSGRGTCDFSSGQCDCFSGQYGERCESQTTFV